MKEKIYIIGSGWGCIGFISNIDTSKYDVNVISKSSNFIYTPLLSHNIYNNYELTENILNVNNKINFINDEVIDLSVNDSEIITKRGKIKYNKIIFSHGMTINTFGIKGVDKFCYFLRNNEDAKILKKKINVLKDNSNIAVIGTNLTGAEVVGNLIDYNKFNINAIDGEDLPLKNFDKNIKNHVLNFWKKKGVNCIYSNFVKNIDDKNIYFKNKNLSYDLAIWCGGYKSTELTKKINKNLKLDCKYGIPVDDYLNIINYKNMYAIGDCAYTKDNPGAQLAYQQGVYLANNFNNDFNNKNKFNFNHKGQICYIGNYNSVYQLGNLKSTGYFTYLFNEIIHIYNGINFSQKFKFIFGKFDK